MKRRLFYILLALALLAGCGGGTTMLAPDSAAPQPSAGPPARHTLPSVFPLRIAEDTGWTVCLDGWDHTEVDGTVVSLTVYTASGEVYQKLWSPSETGFSICQVKEGYGWPADPRYPPLIDLNFDGEVDIIVPFNRIRCEMFNAFLWDVERQRFVEEPTFREIRRPHPMDGYIFENCSGGAANTRYGAYRYSRETGFELVRSLNVDSSPDEVGLFFYTDLSYEGGREIWRSETTHREEVSCFWDAYIAYCDELVFG